MTKWLTSVACALTVALALANASFAQTIPQLEINVFGTANAHTKSEFQIGSPQSVTPIPAEFKFDDALGGGIRFNVHTSGHWGEEFFYSYEPNEGHYLRPSQRLDLPLQIHHFGANGLFYFNSNEQARTRPFLTFGLGALVYRPTVETAAFVRDPLRGNLPGFDQSNELAFNYGIGFKEHIAGIYGLRMDVKHIISRFPSFSLAKQSNDPTAVVLPTEGAIHSFEVSAGVVFYFKKWSGQK